MEKDTHITDIIFRVDTTRDFKGTVFAVFPHEVADLRGHVTTYQHVGQHSAGDYSECIRTSNGASEDEYADLKKEMEGFGYNIKVVKQRNYEKYNTEYNRVRIL